MKSLKRTLSLVLALVMVLGLFGGLTASAAEFTDDEDVQYKEAVEVVTGIGAINGMGDGTFNPKGTITRAQAAKIVAYTALGASAPELLKNDVPSSFSDVTVEGGFDWAIPSIEWLVKEGAINGLPDGTFNPNGNISGYAMLKMLLCCLGYGANDEFVGPGWEMNTLVQANKIGLPAGRNSKEALSKDATREEAALYCFNTLGSEVVVWNDLKKLYEGDGTPVYNPDNDCDDKTLGDNVYGLKTVDAVIYKNGSNDATCAAKGFTTAYMYGSGLDSAASPNQEQCFKLDTGLDLLGHHVTMYYKDATTGGSSTQPYVAYSVIDKSTVKTISKTMTSGNDNDNKAAIKTALGLTVTADAGISASDANCSFNYTSYSANKCNGANLIATTGTSTSNSTPICTATGYIQAQVGQYIFSGDQLISYIDVPTYDVSTVTKYEAPTEKKDGSLEVEASTILGNATASPVISTNQKIILPKTTETDKDKLAAFSALKIYETPEKGDVILISESGDLISITKAETVTGKVTDAKYTSASKGSITMDGTTYDLGAGFASAASLNVENLMTFASAADAAKLVNKEVILYLDASGKVVVAATVSEEDNSNLVYVVKAFGEKVVVNNYGTTETMMTKLQCVDMNGKEVIYTVGAFTEDSGTWDVPVSDVKPDVEQANHTTLSTDVAGGIALDPDPATGSSEITTGNIVGTLISVTTEENKAAGGELATVNTVDYVVGQSNNTADSGSVTGPKSASAVLIDAKNYYTENTKFIFVTKHSENLTVTTAEGPQAIPKGATALYYSDSPDENGNFNVKYVVVLKQPDATASTDLVYVPRVFTQNEPSGYVNVDGKDAVAYLNTVYINGEATKIKMVGNGAKIEDTDGNDLVSVGNEKFYTYSVNDQGIYSLTLASDTQWAVGSVRNVKGDLITINAASNDGDMSDVSAASAKIADPVYDAAYAADKNTNAVNHDSLNLLLDDDGATAGNQASKIAYSYTNNNGVKTITAIYYMDVAAVKQDAIDVESVTLHFIDSNGRDIATTLTSSHITITNATISTGSATGVASTVSANGAITIAAHNDATLLNALKGGTAKMKIDITLASGNYSRVTENPVTDVKGGSGASNAWQAADDTTYNVKITTEYGTEATYAVTLDVVA